MSNARGTVLTWNGDKGIVTSSGNRLEFDIGHWKGECAPKPDMVVAVGINDGLLDSLTPFSDADMAKENLARAGDKGAAIARGIFADVGVDVAIGYGGFLLCALAFAIIQGQGFLAAASIKLVTVLSGIGSSETSGVLAVLIASASIAVPFFWKHKYAPLAFCLPLLVTLYADYQLYRIYSQAKAQLEQLSSFTGSLFGHMGASGATGASVSPFSIGFGFYATLAVSAFLAFRGVQRYQRAGK